jgi:hypothetical protein
MMRAATLWLVAIVVTLGAAVWQRVSGPTYPARGTVSLGGELLRLRLPRSATTGAPLRVSVPAHATVRNAEIAWRRYPSSEAWRRERLVGDDSGHLTAAIPSQPPAGKVEYQLRLVGENDTQATFPDRPAVARFKGPVPQATLIPHIALMFAAMLWSTRAGLGAVLGGPARPRLVLVTLGLVVVGGLIFGPLVQKAAFGAAWTGWPFGHDLTDNKTAIAAAAWAWAAWRQRRGASGRVSVAVAALVTLTVFSIPHSTWGSELAWDEIGGTSAAASLADGEWLATS